MKFLLFDFAPDSGGWRGRENGRDWSVRGGKI